MSTKAFTPRLIVESAEARAALWRTHQVFNERLRHVLRHMHRMKRGEADPRYARIFDAIKSNQHATAVMEAVTSKTAKPGKADEWAQLARQLLQEGKLLFDRFQELSALSKEFRRKLFESAYQAMSSHEELLALWASEHKEWLKARESWETEHPEYMKARPALVAFEEEHGQAAKRRGRWHKWLEFLQANPTLAAWRGGDPVVNPLSEEGKQLLRRAKRNKRNKVEAEQFFKTNPELAELDKLHDYYQHRPTFTEPSP